MTQARERDGDSLVNAATIYELQETIAELERRNDDILREFAQYKEVVSGQISKFRQSVEQGTGHTADSHVQTIRSLEQRSETNSDASM